MNSDTGVVSSIRVTHERATVEQIESVCAPDQQTLVESLLANEHVNEAFAIQTCNRVEAYVVTEAPELGRSALAQFAPDLSDDIPVSMGHEESLRHLMRVASGLESLVLGEDQILGQVSDAYEDARQIDAIGPVLEDGITKAIHVGERARTETAINEGTLSIGSAASKLAASERDLTDATALVVGAGEMGSLTAHALADTDIRTLYVANRTLSRAERVASEVEFTDTRPVDAESLPDCLEQADVVISATGSEEYVIDAELLDGCGRTLVIDIAQPRDVSPTAATVDGVTVEDIDTLESVTSATREQRSRAARTVETMIDAEFDRLLAQYKRKRADEVISTMYAGAERIKARELSTAFSKLEANGDLSAEGRDIIESLADSLVSQLLAAPTQSLRDAAEDDDWTTINTALQLFDPELDGEVPRFIAENAPAGTSDGRRANADDD